MGGSCATNGGRRGAYRVCVGNLRREGSHLEELVVDGRINGSSGNRTGGGLG